MAVVRIFTASGAAGPGGNVRHAPGAPAQTIEIGASSTGSTEINLLSGTEGLVTVQADADCHIVFGTGSQPTATTDSWKLTAGQPEDFWVHRGAYAAVIEA